MQSKPDWKDAPKWARYLAMDADGTWWFYECKPRKGDESWNCYGDGRLQSAIEPDSIEWDASLEQRP